MDLLHSSTCFSSRTSLLSLVFKREKYLVILYLGSSIVLGKVPLSNDKYRVLGQVVKCVELPDMMDSVVGVNSVEFN